MAAAQILYEGVAVPGRGTLGLITYMRTDSLRITPEAIDAARGIIGARFGAEYLPQKARVYKTGKALRTRTKQSVRQWLIFSPR